MWSMLNSKEWWDRHCLIPADPAVGADVAARVNESADELARRFLPFQPAPLYEDEKRLLAHMAEGVERAHAGGYCAAVAVACAAATADALVRVACDAEDVNPALLQDRTGHPSGDAPHAVAVRKLLNGVNAVANELSPPEMARPSHPHGAARRIRQSRFSGAKSDALGLLGRLAAYHPDDDSRGHLVYALTLYLAQAFEAAHSFGVRDGGGWEGAGAWAERAGGAAVLLVTYARTPY